ncbi:BolA/IbaG family iron-sulfur metabolism protein [bacterium]|nr:BolA/IbaG family iron-sulfur metabolism protein [bacterium]
MKTQEIKARLQQNYPDGTVDVTDLTGTEDHYSVFVSSKKFVGLTRIQCHKQVMSVFDAELKTGEVHALTIKTETLKEN